MMTQFRKRISLSRLILGFFLAYGPIGYLFLIPLPAYAADCQARYTVQRGETLYRIGLRFNMTWDRIAFANNITNSDRIYAGQVLCIPEPITSSQGEFTVLSTDVAYVKTLTDVNMRVGPGKGYHPLGIVKMGQVIQVTGLSSNGNWWRVICPDKTIGNCWVTAGAKYTQPTTISVTPNPRPGVIPTFSIVAVRRDQTVTIQTADFPERMKFNVLMGPFGSAGVNGYYVTTIDSGVGGAFEATYTIPEPLRGSNLIAIRLEGSSGYYSYNWFWNTTSE